MSRSHAWIRRGDVMLDPRPMNWGTSLTMIGAMRRGGWVTMSTLFGSANAERFVTWARRRLAPKLRRGDVVILDNAAAHKDRASFPWSRRVEPASNFCRRTRRI